MRDHTHAWRIVAAAGHPALGLCLDSFHSLSRGLGPGTLAGIQGERIFFLQLADALVMALDVLQWSRHFRNFPGQGGFDLTGYTREVLDAGYRGPLSLEVSNDVFRQADAERTAVDAMRSLLLLDETLITPDDDTARPGDARGGTDGRPATDWSRAPNCESRPSTGTLVSGADVRTGARGIV
ncbi:MAG: TIM barrel protein [Streptosporangiales bacterium]|nr:TIM barrel protein [Streptosporangiales bacterium]